MFTRLRKCYFFGYGADSEPELIHSITGHKPKLIGTAVLEDYELRVQRLWEVTQSGNNPQRILRSAWGDTFKSYIIIPKHGAVVKGALYRITLHDRHMIDKWELVEEGWYDKAFVTVKLLESHKSFDAETQVLGRGQRAHLSADGIGYPSWLMPKTQLLQMAVTVRSQAGYIGSLWL